MWYITFHGGKHSNNIRAYDNSGNLLKKRVLKKKSSTGKLRLKELRAIGVGPDGYLWVVNAYRKRSEILRFEGTPRKDGRHRYVDHYASERTVKGIVHPFAFAFDEHGRCFISSQDTNVVTGIAAKDTPMPIAPFLRELQGSHFLEGTFVASSRGRLPRSPMVTTDVDAPQGLGVAFETSRSGKVKVHHSVRDILFYEQFLYVADEAADAVKVYDQTGTLIHSITDDELKAPVHLLREGDNIYIGSTKDKKILCYTVKTMKLSHVVSGINEISGIAIGCDGRLYIASRTNSVADPSSSGTIWRCNVDGSALRVFIATLPDSPEFILPMPH